MKMLDRRGLVVLYTVVRAMIAAVCLGLTVPSQLLAQSTWIEGRVLDESGAALPAVAVELRFESRSTRETLTDADGRYRFDGPESGRASVCFSLVQFATSRHTLMVPDGGPLRLDVVMRLALDADVVVTGKSTFTNLADVENPTQGLIGIARSASQGAITAR